jgi:translation initiation factor IF-3
LEVLTRVHGRTIRQVRLVGEGSNEVVNFESALRQAEEEGLDLVLISTKSDPPVVRIQDFKKVQYEQKKAKKVVKASELKEIQLKINITDHDLGTKINAIQKFLDRGDKVKVSVRLKGRERETPERGRILVDKIIAAIPCKVNQMMGPNIAVILEPSATK